MSERTDHTPRSAGSNPVRVRFDRFELDEANARLLRDGSPVAVAPTPFGVLCALARQPGSLLTTNALLDEVWGHQYVTDSVLRTAISELRTALDDETANTANRTDPLIGGYDLATVRTESVQWTTQIPK